VFFSYTKRKTPGILPGVFLFLGDEYTAGMGWAARRRFFIFLGLGLLGALIFFGASFFTFHRAPSCVDNIQNQEEQGVDCGGSCPYLCTALEEEPSVRFTTALAGAPGRTDIIAYVDNKNAHAAARNVPYDIKLYGADHQLVQNVTGTIDLPAGASVPVFVPGVSSGNQQVSEAFLTIDPTNVHWYATEDTRTVPSVGSPVLFGTTEAPRIRATLTNPSTTPLRNVRTLILVYNLKGNVMAASQTIVATIPSQSSADAVFTWNQPFSDSVSSIEVVPIIP